MPQTFGPPGYSYELVDAQSVRADRRRFRRDLFHELERANSYYSMSGRWPDVGWLLMDRGTFTQINPYATNLQLVIQDFVNPPLTISNLTVVQARCVTRGLPSDPNSIYLIQVTNTEGVLYNPWFQFPVNRTYNVRSPAYDTQYYSDSMNSGVAWTWDTMVGDLWAQAPTQLGTYPHLPITPTNAPENFIFVGASLWEAISHVMDYLGLAISGNLGSFTIVVPGAADAAYSAQITKYAADLEDSMQYLDAGAGRVPGSVVVYFNKRYQIYGTEETVRRDSSQWQGVPSYSVTVPAPAQFSSGPGVAFIWADFTVRYDINNSPLAADVTTAAAVALERATQYYNTIYRGGQGFSKLVYGGVLPFVTGSLVDGVRWFQTGFIGENEDRWGGWRTELIRGYIWEEATFPLTLQGLTGPT